jgi:WD40 repeat protein
LDAGITHLAVSKGTVNDLDTTIFATSDKQIGSWVYNSANGKLVDSQVTTPLGGKAGTISALTVSGSIVSVGLSNGNDVDFTRGKRGRLTQNFVQALTGKPDFSIQKVDAGNLWLIANAGLVWIVSVGDTGLGDFMDPNRQLGFPAGTMLTSMALSSNQKLLAISGNDGTVHLYDASLKPNAATWRKDGPPPKKDKAGEPIVLK